LIRSLFNAAAKWTRLMAGTSTSTRARTKITAWVTLLVFFLSLSWPAGLAGAYTETSRTSETEPVAEGVTVERLNIRTTEGPLNIYVMKVDMANEYVKVDTLVGSGGVITTNRSTSNLAKEAGAVAAVNGDFFQMKEKAPIGITVQSGELVTSPALTTSMNAFGLTGDNVPVFTVFGFQGAVTAPSGIQHQLSGINKPTYQVTKDVNSDVNRLNMYTPRWGAKSRGLLQGLTGTVEMVVEYDRVKEFRLDQPGTDIPASGYVLAGHGTAAEFLQQNFLVGDQVQVSYKVIPETDNLQAAIGGQAILIKDGKRHWFSNTIFGNHARTAIGASRDGKTLYLVVADGGQTSRGMTQEEMADFMISVGAWTALNLDGGGSSAMAVRQLGDETVTLINNPSQGSERSIPTGLGIFSTAPPGELAGLKVTGPRVMVVGTTKNFTAKGYDEHYNPYYVMIDDISWTVSPGSLGRFDGSAFGAEGSGEGKVKASYRGVTREYPVRVLGSADIARLEVNPSAIAVRPGESVAFSVKVVTKQGEVFNLQPGEYEVRVGGDVGTVTGNKFTAGKSFASGQVTIKVDSTQAVVRVAVGSVEKPFYGFETARNLKYRGYPEGQVPGSFRLIKPDEPSFRGVGAARLEYDFTATDKTRAAYGNFEGGLALPGQPMGIGLWVLGDGGNSHWLRARITDASGTEKLIDLARNVDWKGWKHVTGDLPAGIQYPVTLTDIYLVEPEKGPGDKGVIYFDEISLIYPPEAGETGTAPEAQSVQKVIDPGIPVPVKLGTDLEMTFNNPAKSPVYTVKARQLWETELGTPGYNPVMPLFTVSGEADGDTQERLPGPVKITIGFKGISEPNRLRVMWWNGKKAAWQSIPAVTDIGAGTVTAKTDRLGTLGLMVDARPLPRFSDTDSSWAKGIISDMAGKRIVNGYPDGSFLPAKGVTRAEFVTLLTNTLGWEPEAEGLNFSDSIPAWAQGSTAAAVKLGVVRGYEDGTFRPHRVITRAEMAAILNQALALPDSTTPSSYDDWRDIASWAVQPVRNTKEAGVMQGSGNKFRPRDIANRAEATAVMARVLEYYVTH